ncbi:MAG: YfhO family protein [Treponema sp.]|nr:YfhO family protein [Treponema sp.]
MKIKTSLALSFALPFTIMGTAFALHGVYPFGNRQMLAGDLYHQHYPFLNNFWHQLREGTIGSWSWAAGGGHDYVALFAYYLASPLYLSAVLAPHSWLREIMTLLLLIKIGCAGLFTGIFLQYSNRSDHPQIAGGECQMRVVIPVFSALYALCAYTQGYYSHILWFDSFALLPLVMLGLTTLMNEGKYRLYVISLALAVFTNYHIGFFICVFIVIIFFSQYIIQKWNYKDFLRKLGLITGYSLLAVGMTAVLLIPTWFALQNTSLQFSPPSEVFLFTSFFSVLGNFIAFQPPTIFYGPPNLYSSMITVLLAGLFVVSSKTSRREKIVLAGIILFLILSFNINVLEYIWNGFNYARGSLARYSFLLIFLLVVMAYRAFVYTENTSRKNFPVMGISAALFLLAAVFGSQEMSTIIGSAVLCAVYILLLFIKSKGTGRVQRFMVNAVFLVIVAELLISSWIGIKTNGTTGRDEFPGHYEHIQELLELRRPAGVNYYRTDINYANGLNSSFLYHYNGISMYSSTVNINAAGFMQRLGLLGYDRNFYYSDITPLLNAFFNIRYVISTDGSLKDNGIYWEPAGESGDVLMLENKYYLPLGFMVKENLTGYVNQNDNPFSAQNDLFSRATGLNDNLFTITNITNTPAQTGNINGDNFLFWNYTMPSNGMLYVYIENDTDIQPGVFVNGVFLDYIFIPDFYISNLTAVGLLAQGDIITFTVKEGIDFLMYAGHFDSALFGQGYAQLASQPLTLTHFSNTLVKGHVTAHEDGLLYTSIPGDRNWSVYVNGVKNDIVLIDNAMAAVRLNQGTHEIEFRYFNRSFLAGIIISLASLAIFAVLIWVKRFQVTGR